jgi:hypothetical protein
MVRAQRIDVDEDEIETLQAGDLRRFAHPTRGQRRREGELYENDESDHGSIGHGDSFFARVIAQSGDRPAA